MPRAGILALLMIAAPALYAADRPLTAAEERALNPKDSFRECDVCPDMVVLPEGSFMMGSTPAEIEALVNETKVDHPRREGPQRRVTIARPFAVGRYEVTFAEWDVCGRKVDANTGLATKAGAAASGR